MQRNVILSVGALALAAFSLASCPAAVSRGEVGVVRVSLNAAASRGVLDAPSFPVFSSGTVTITGSGMAPVTGSLVGGSATLTVPGGSGRVVTVEAIPDWAATAAANPGAGVPRFARRYGGAATVDVASGETVSVKIDLAVTETRILLPDAMSGDVYIAESFASLSSLSAMANPGGFAAWDRYGRFFTIQDSTIERYADPFSGTPDMVIDTYSIPINPVRLAVDNARGRLYYMPSEEGPGYFDGATENHVRLNPPATPFDFETNAASLIAVDETGALYITGWDPMTDVWYIVKASVGEAYGSAGNYYADRRLLATITFNAAALTYTPGDPPLFPTDMIVIGDTVYLSATDINEYVKSRGKVVAMSTDLTNVRQIGWCGDAPDFPGAGKENQQFYGPFAFLGVAPNKLYIGDGGFTVDPVLNAEGRVFELTLSPLAITGVSGLPAGLAFFEIAY